MMLPTGYSGVGGKVNVEEGEKKTTLVCKLQKSLYGLKQTPRQWFAKLSTALKQSGFVQSKADYFLFTQTVSDKGVAVRLYVDDLLIAGNNEAMIDQVKKMLCKSFMMKDLGGLRYFLGIEVDRSTQGFFLSQKKYVQDLIKEYGMTKARPLKIPIDPAIKLNAELGLYLTCLYIKD